jgi:hypothetical protein
MGISARHIAQEHSYVPDMWLRLTHPKFLVYLHVSYLVSKHRRKLDWSEGDYLEQVRRLAHARQNATLYIDTDPLDPQDVLDVVVSQLHLDQDR